MKYYRLFNYLHSRDGVSRTKTSRIQSFDILSLRKDLEYDNDEDSFTSCCIQVTEGVYWTEWEYNDGINHEYHSKLIDSGPSELMIP